MRLLLLLLAGAHALRLPMRQQPPECIRHAAAAMMASDEPEEVSLASKSVWFATELFGKASAMLRGTEAAPVSQSNAAAPASLDDAIARLTTDYAGTPDDPRPYFLTGMMDAELCAIHAISSAQMKP